jgi:demethoxyubiquinone hydroxylase (CLK1/Coq7/Cat5 family)
MEITQQELTELNFYRASELYGGLVLGQVSRRVREPELLLELIRHSAEEVVHAELWTATILAVGGTPRPTRDTYQSRYAVIVGRPAGLLQVLALTQVFERRVYRHFTEHLRRPAVHPLVQTTLRRMLEEEKGHLSWVKRWLHVQALARPEAVHDAMRRYTKADRQVYESLMEDYGYRQAA